MLDTRTEKELPAIATDSDHPTRRFHALQELLTTEQAYCDSLHVMVKVHFRNLNSLSFLSLDEIVTIHRNAERILALHQRIANQLRLIQRELEWHKAQIHDRNKDAHKRDLLVARTARHVAEVFLNEIQNFALYNDFCARHQEAIDVIRQINHFQEWTTFEQTCAAHHNQGTASIEQSQYSKLRFQDYLIKPIQRLCRYPLILAQILKNWEQGPDQTRVRQAHTALQRVACTVDQHSQDRARALKTRLVAKRLNFQASINVSFCDILGPTLLVGSLHVLARTYVQDLKVKYYAVLLYRSHIFLVKPRKLTLYEPREWLPIRICDIINLDEGESLLPFAIRLRCNQHEFDLSAACDAEKRIWLAALLSARSAAQLTWHSQQRAPADVGTVFDDITISSVAASIQRSPNSPAIPLPLHNHARSRSTASMSALFEKSLSEEPLSTLSSANVSKNTSPEHLDSPLPTPSSATTTIGRNRFSTIVGKAPSTQRAAIDLRLADVFSEELLVARTQGVREFTALQAAHRLSVPVPDSRKTSTLRLARRQSESRLEEFGAGSALGLTGIEGPWEVKAIKRAKTFATLKRTSLPVLAIDTNLGRTVKASPTKLKRLSVFAGLSSSPIQPPLVPLVSLTGNETTLLTPTQTTSNTPKATTIVPSADVERNNSVTSTVSSTASSSAFYQKNPVDSPASSVSVSPLFEPVNLSEVPSRWTSLSRRKSHLGFRPSREPVKTSTATPSTSLLSRSQSTTTTNANGRQKLRIQSSPSLTGYFGAPLFLPPAPRPSLNFATPIHDLLSSSPSQSTIEILEPEVINRIHRSATEPPAIGERDAQTLSRRHSFKARFKFAFTPIGKSKPTL